MYRYNTIQYNTAECLKSSIFEYLSENHISAEKLLSVGCNGTNINTGRAGGAITLLAQQLRNHYSSLSACFMVMNSLSDTYSRSACILLHCLVNACQHVNSCR